MRPILKDIIAATWAFTCSTTCAHAQQRQEAQLPPSFFIEGVKDGRDYVQMGYFNHGALNMWPRPVYRDEQPAYFQQSLKILDAARKKPATQPITCRIITDDPKTHMSVHIQTQFTTDKYALVLQITNAIAEMAKQIDIEKQKLIARQMKRLGLPEAEMPQKPALRYTANCPTQG